MRDTSRDEELVASKAKVEAARELWYHAKNVADRLEQAYWEAATAHEMLLDSVQVE